MRVIKRKYKDKVVQSYLDLVPLCDHFCEICKTRKDLTAHHIRERRHGGTDDLDNLMVLCKTHHELVHNERNNFVTEIYINLNSVRRIKRRNEYLRRILKDSHTGSHE